MAETTTDAAGQAVVGIEHDDCTVWVRALGFQSFRYKVDPHLKNIHTIAAVLRLGDIGSGYPLNVERIIQPERQILNASIPDQELESLTNLPTHLLRLRSHHKTR
jgi:hypothetical protein